MKSKLLKMLLSLCMVAGIAILQSCTLDEPENNGDETTSTGRLAKVSSMGITMLEYEYDSSNRLIGISGEMTDEEKVTISYTPEMTVTIEEWDDYGYTGKTVWTNIETNAKGYITKLKSTEYTYVNGSWQLDEDPVAWMTFNYDANGHLKSYVDLDGQTNVWNWDANGLLLSAQSDEDIFMYRYDDATLLNPNGQWSIDNGPLMYWMPTNLFGKGPSKFPTSATLGNGYDHQEGVQWAYALNKSNYISSVKMSEDGDYAITLNYSYAK